MKKSKKYISLMLACMLALGGCNVSQSKATSPEMKTESAAVATETASIEDFEYEAQDGGIVLNKYNGKSEILTIPSEVDGKAVTKIGESCFAGNVTLRKVHVPEGVTELADYAFECCGSLEKIYLPESLKKIGNGSFSGCGSLHLVDIQDQVEAIGDGAFLSCISLPYFIAPASLKEMGQFAFARCTSLYFVDLGKTQLKEIKGRSFYRGQVLARLVLPETVERIGKRAFSECTTMNYLYLPESVNYLESYAFENCEKFTSAEIRGGEVEANAFYGCYGINGANFDEKDTILHKDAFAGTSLNQKELYIPECVVIEEGAFPVYTENGTEEGAEEGGFQEEGGIGEGGIGEGIGEGTQAAAAVTPDTKETKTSEEILKAAADAGYRVVNNDDFDKWADEYLAYNEGNIIEERSKNVFTDMYKVQIEGFYAAMTAVATKDPDDIENAHRQHGDDFMPMYEMANHGLLTEMRRFKMKDDMLLLTGVYDSQLKAAAGTSEVPTMEELKARIGQKFTDPSLTSTTNDINVAVDFSDTMFIIYAPAESVNTLGAVAMDAYMRTAENETLLFSGAEYEILDVGYFSYPRLNYETEKEDTAYEKYVLVKLIN